MATESSSEEKKFGSGAMIAVVIAAACLGGLVILPKLARSSHKMVGTEAPTFALPIVANSAEGARIDLKEMRGHAVLLDFWASWCGPCAMQAPILEKVAAHYQGKGLTVVGVNVDDEAAVVQRYAAQRGISYPMVVDEGGAVQRAYGVNKLPSLVLIDKEGHVTSFTQGLVDEASLDSIVADSL